MHTNLQQRRRDSDNLPPRRTRKCPTTRQRGTHSLDRPSHPSASQASSAPAPLRALPDPPRSAPLLSAPTPAPPPALAPSRGVTGCACPSPRGNGQCQLKLWVQTSLMRSCWQGMVGAKTGQCACFVGRAPTAAGAECRRWRIRSRVCTSPRPMVAVRPKRTCTCSGVGAPAAAGAAWGPGAVANTTSRKRRGQPRGSSRKSNSLRLRRSSIGPDLPR